MNKTLKRKLLKIAEDHITAVDPSHDLNHSLNVLYNAELIQKHEEGDLRVIIPAALFHDLVNLPKNDPRAKMAPDLSAKKTLELIADIGELQDSAVLQKIYESIANCSFSNKKQSSLIEAKIIQDADLLASTGAVSIMRTFASVGVMGGQLYNKDDPFCESRAPESLRYGLDLFYSRLLRVTDKMSTSTAKKIAIKRTNFLNSFLEQLRTEIADINIDEISNSAQDGQSVL